MKRIIYNNNDGGLSVIIPSESSGLTVEQIAAKDVPTGVPYLIIEATDLPADRSQRQAWEADFTNPHGIGE